MQSIINDSNYLRYLKNYINQAVRHIYISSFKIEITNKPRGRKLKDIFQDLISKSKNGVDIRLLINWHNDRRSVAKTNLSAAYYLRKNGIAVRHLTNNRCCHSKLFIFDKEKAIIGSHNLSVKSCCNNFELSIFTDTPQLVSDLSCIFLHSWSDAKLF